MAADAGFRISPQQKRVWQLQGPHCWRARALLHIDGDLGPGELRSALAAVVRRNEALRTVFRLHPGRTLPLQVILEGEPFVLEEHELGGRSIEEQQAWIEEAYAGLGSRSLDPGAEPVLHAVAARLGPGRHALALALPALDADTASLAHLAQRLLAACLARRSGRALSDEPAQYADLAEWALELAESEEAQREAERWRGDELADAAALRLPFGRAGADHAFRTGAVDVDLPTELPALLLARGLSPEAFVLAGWQALLGRLTGAARLAVGISGTGRDVQGLETALGLFERVVPLAERPAGEEGLAHLAGRVAEGLRAVRERQHYFTWDAIVPPRAGDPPPFLPFAFRWAQEGPGPRADGLSAAIARLEANADRFAVRAAFQAEGGGRARGQLQYDAALYERADVERLAGSLAALLRDAAERPEAPVDDLSLLGDAERRRVLYDFNPAGPGFPAERQVQDLIGEWAERTPEAIAVACGAEAMSYRGLVARARSLAERLRAEGVGPDAPVLLFVERSIEMVVGILAVLEAGGAYVPLDPSYPRERLAFILEDSAPPVVLTQSRLADRLPDHAASTVILDGQLAGPGAATPAGAPAGPDQLAYVIYTSGSTGRPKGVLVTRRNLMHSTHARLQYYEKPVGRFLLLSSFAFDSSVAGIFWTLASGGTLVVPPEGAEKDLRRVVGLVRDHAITHMLCLGSLHDVLLAEADPRDLASLEVAIVAGEACTNDLVARHRRILPGTRLFNEYGPTEATVWSSVYDCADHEGPGPVPIGRPIPNARIYVLDPSRRPAPVGVAGELYVGGPGVARGYLNRPELSAERFVPDPFGPAGARLYRTGDSVRFRTDGNLEFLGRLDHQVKLRGFRIELGEIEQVLSAHAAVKAAAVLVRDTVARARQLAAYVALKAGGPAPTVTELRSHVRERLPEYMVPAAFEILDELPVNAHGKIDRAALARLTGPAGAAPPATRSPRTPTEALVAATCAEALGHAHVGVGDTFLDLGGNSLLAMKVIARLEARLGVRIHPRELLYGTLEQFSASLERPRASAPAARTSWWRRVTGRFGELLRGSSAQALAVLPLDPLGLACLLSG